MRGRKENNRGICYAVFYDWFFGIVSIRKSPADKKNCIKNGWEHWLENGWIGEEYEHFRDCKQGI